MSRRNYSNSEPTLQKGMTLARVASKRDLAGVNERLLQFHHHHPAIEPRTLYRPRREFLLPVLRSREIQLQKAVGNLAIRQVLLRILEEVPSLVGPIVPNFDSVSSTVNVSGEQFLTINPSQEDYDRIVNARERALEVVESFAPYAQFQWSNYKADITLAYFPNTVSAELVELAKEAAAVALPVDIRLSPLRYSGPPNISLPDRVQTIN